MLRLILLGVSIFLTPFAQAANIEAGKQLATTVCAACHGANGVSVSETLPNLAAQRASYIEAQLKLYKDGTRKAPGGTSPTLTMGAIASQLNAEDIANTAAYFSSLPGAAAGAKSAQLPNVAKTNVTFPEGYKETFTKYHAINFPETKQVRFYYANKTAVEAAKAGKSLPDGSMIFTETWSTKLDDGGRPVKGTDGFFTADKLVGYSGMARDVDWGKDIPEMLRNENWNYAVFTTDKQYRPVNQAECLACHKPLKDSSYTFTLGHLAEAKQQP